MLRLVDYGEVLALVRQRLLWICEFLVDNVDHMRQSYGGLVYRQVCGVHDRLGGHTGHLVEAHPSLLQLSHLWNVAARVYQGPQCALALGKVGSNLLQRPHNHLVSVGKSVSQIEPEAAANHVAAQEVVQFLQRLQVQVLSGSSDGVFEVLDLPEQNRTNTSLGKGLLVGIGEGVVVAGSFVEDILEERVAFFKSRLLEHEMAFSRKTLAVQFLQEEPGVVCRVRVVVVVKLVFCW